MSARTPVVDLQSRVLLAFTLLSVGLLSACGGDSGYGYGSVCGYDALGNPLFCGGDFCGFDALGNPVSCAPSTVAADAKRATCGGTFAVAQALGNAATQAFSFLVSSQDRQGNTYLVDYSTAPGGASVFNGRPAISAIVTQTLYQNGVASESTTTTSYFDSRSGAFLGSNSALAGRSEVATASQGAPAGAVVGQTFPMFSANLYHDAAFSVLDGTLTETLGVQADTAATALLCRQDSVQLTTSGIADGLNASPRSTCLRIDAAGNLLGIQLSIPVNGSLLTFR
jgi:hypothetical protein